MSNTIHISKSVIKTTSTLTRAQRKDLLGIETPLDKAMALGSARISIVSAIASIRSTDIITATARSAPC